MVVELFRILRTFVAYFGRTERLSEAFVNREELRLAKANPLTLAAFSGEIASAQNLMQAGRTPNVLLKGGTTPLACAAGNGHIEIVRLLLDHGAEVDAANQAALKRGAGKGHLEVVLALLNVGARVEINNTEAPKGTRPLSDYSVLEYAVHGGHASIVKTLLSHGADPNGGTGSALQVAAMHGHLEIVSELLAHGANVNSQSRPGYSALGFAAARGHASVVRMLLDGGADVTESVLRAATSRLGNETVVQMLKEKGAA